MNSTIENIINKINQNENLTNEQKTELVSLIDSLKKELSNISEPQQAQEIANVTKTTVAEAIRHQKDIDLFDNSIHSLTSSAKTFETSHPDLLKTIETITLYLSDLGI
jgi:hypothetical protein